MTFYADLHIHSKYSRATSRDCDLEHLSLWARKKGITLLGTGDFTYPAWLQEIKDKLTPAEPGLFRLRPDLEQELERQNDLPHTPPTRFMLEVEISTIYKKGEKTRKVHHLIYVPDLEKAECLIRNLSRIGNLNADGRPILGLDSRDLLEITLACGEGSYLIPAHIWTPWFSALGSKSGFDAIEECYGDLSSHIFAVETGLSSDPPMNRRLSALDRYTLVSNSDAHSPPKIAREANRFNTDLDYFAIRRALETGRGFGGTVEFFPEEGKYHLDGHRKCGVRFAPDETRNLNGLCPTCNKPLTVGVMHRVAELADRGEADATPASTMPYRSLIPLPEVVSEIQGVGPKSKAVAQTYEGLVSRLGSELFILEQAPIEDIPNIGATLLAEAIKRMRANKVIRQAGYDGEYGVIRLFEDAELKQSSSIGMLFELPPSREPPGAASKHCVEPDKDERPVEKTSGNPPRRPSSKDLRTTVEQLPAIQRSQNVGAKDHTRTSSNHLLDSLDPDQRAAAEITEGPLLIIAGPGSGKTRALTYRIAHLIQQHGVSPEQCLAITFTNRAADEMRERLRRLLPDDARVPVMTFHALGLHILREHGARIGLPESFRVATQDEQIAVLKQALATSKKRKAQQWLKKHSLKHDRESAATKHQEETEAYQREMHDRGWVDFDGLIRWPLLLLEENPDIADRYRKRYPRISIDEYQDLDPFQYRLLKLLVPPDGHICAIGDPDQSIYGFRGAEVAFFQRFTEDFPSARIMQLTTNYRSTRSIVDASLQMISPATLIEGRVLNALLETPDRITIHENRSERAEAEFVVHTIERMIGGSTFFSLDSQRVESHEGADFSFADFAVLYRTDAQTPPLCEALARSGMPYQKRTHQALSDNPLVQALIQKMEQDTRTAVPVTERLDRAVAEVQLTTDNTQIVLIHDALRPEAERCENDLDRFRDILAMGMDLDLWDPRADRVSLLTLHAAKGLEFKAVFIVGCEEGIVPLRWNAADDSDLAEERRIFFVGMTRAKQRLFLSHVKKRRWRGTIREMDSSLFLRDIEEKLLQHSRQRLHKKRPRPAGEQLDLWE